jgi:hypothetical protein
MTAKQNYIINLTLNACQYLSNSIVKHLISFSNVALIKNLLLQTIETKFPSKQNIANKE